ncbi:nuclear transport factor 2 family protein [Hymenobacter latericus]|uniref:nuclear transport factor 2 family protein n=1 Tax=Hymenobacter sp. YIM 151858-1 TaxID=2987688 RepID=UPI0022268DFB|nr:nuclear transport factor 2 family protein [Hymenobacter sp. YIM 151858-1]UYZ60593.1 nuclear transport factor 2 family protein [Hymenobacter sp. YIM 151858-1]
MKPALLCLLLLLGAPAVHAQKRPVKRPAPAARPAQPVVPAPAPEPAPAPALSEAEQVVQRQLDAYNARNLDAFAATYHEQVELLTFPATLRSKGVAKLREGYGQFFAQTPDLHCQIMHRTVLGNKVIDHERVTGLPNGQVLEAVAIYEVENGLIRRVTFVQ